MRFAFSSNAFRRYSLLESIDILADLGYEGVEIMADVPHAYPDHLTPRDVRAIRVALDRHQMKVSNINAFMLHAEGDTYHPSWIEQDPELRSRRVRHTLNCIGLAKALGAPTVSTEPGGPLKGVTLEEGLLLFRDGLLRVADAAVVNGIRVLIEPEPELLIENSVQFREFVAGLDQEVFGLNFDIGHFFCVGEDPCTAVGGLWEFIDHFHLEDIGANRVHHHLIPGEGAIDLGAVLTTISGLGYTDFVTVELYPYEDHPVEAAARAMEYLQRWRQECLCRDGPP